MVKKPDFSEEYKLKSPLAERFKSAVIEQLMGLIQKHDITLGVPIEGRVKSLSSILEKVDRKGQGISSIFDFDDIVGIRIILLFDRDVTQVKKLIEDNFHVVSSENIAERLTEIQFGYQSIHLISKIPKTWLGVPTLSGFADLKVELQVRTLAQHIWAAASHKLQYKQENSVPFPLKRAIHRVSALLETVDLEFERILDSRSDYLKSNISIGVDGILNVDLFAALLDEMLPPLNKSEDEQYAHLLNQLFELEINTVDKLKGILLSQMEAVKANDLKLLEKNSFFNNNLTTPERSAKGVFYTHCGWVRKSVRLELGDAADIVFDKNLKNFKRNPVKNILRGQLEVDDTN